MASLPQYAAAMAGLTGYQYPTGGQAYMNPAHYPAYTSQYNNIPAAAYWSQQQQQQQILQQSQEQQQSGNAPAEESNGEGKSLSH